MKRALLCMLAVIAVTACGKSEQAVPKSLADANLEGRQWNEDDFRLAAQVSMKQAADLQPVFVDYWKRGDATGAVNASDPLLVTLQAWNDQHDSRYAEPFRLCKLAVSYAVEQAIAIYHEYGFDTATSRFEENRKACLAL